MLSSTFFKVSLSTRSTLFSRITSAQATCLTHISLRALHLGPTWRDLLLRFVHLSIIPRFGQLLHSVSRLWGTASERSLLTLRTFRQSTTQTTPSRIKSPISSFSQKPLMIGPGWDSAHVLSCLQDVKGISRAWAVQSCR